MRKMTKKNQNFKVLAMHGFKTVLGSSSTPVARHWTVEGFAALFGCIILVANSEQNMAVDIVEVSTTSIG